MFTKVVSLFICVLFLLGAIEITQAQGTAFTYQGQLSTNSSPANGNFDFTFSLFTNSTAGNTIAGPITNSAVAVANGLFTTVLDFGSGIFTGTNYWLQISVAPTGSTNFTALTPRQQLTPTPYAIFANTSSNLIGSLPAAQLSGALPSAQLNGIYVNTVNFTNNGDYFTGTFFGNGTNLINLNASQLTGGTVADARLSTNVALLNTNQTFTSSNMFTGVSIFANANGAFQGTFSGGGSSLSNLNASQLTSGTVADARLSTNVPLLNGNQTFTGSNTFNGVNTFTNFANSFRGSFFGNGLVGWIPVPGTNVQAVIDTGYVLTNSQFVTVTLPTSANIGDIIRISGAGSSGWKVALTNGQTILGNFLSYANSYWTLMQSSGNNWDWECIASSADGNKLVAGTDSQGIFVSVNGGVSWSQTYSPPTGAQGVASSADGTKMVAVVYGGGVFTSTNSGASWTQRTTGLPGNSTWDSAASSTDGTKLVAAIYGGKIYTSSNSGLSWSVQSGGPSSANWYSVASSADGTKLVAVAYGGGIYTNSGTSWTATSAPTKNWRSVASSADGARLAAVVNGGGIYTSEDFGVTWVPQPNAPTTNWASIASSADGGKLAAVVSGDGIYISTDSGVTWTQQVNAPIQNWISIASSSDGTKLASAAYGFNSGIYLSQAATQSASTAGTNGAISGGQGSAIELQCISVNQTTNSWMPVSSFGQIWAR